jgi:hypothetical protein
MLVDVETERYLETESRERGRDQNIPTRQAFAYIQR